MKRKRGRQAMAAGMTVVAIACAPIAAAQPPNPCDEPSYRFNHRTECDDTVKTAGPPGSIPGGGGGGSGGLLGLLRHIPGLGGLL